MVGRDIFGKNMGNLKISLKVNKKNVSLDRYAGEWVAFADGKVIAHQTTLKGLMEKVKTLRKKPSVLLVPKKKEGPYV
jgi:hypothetical protein